MQATQDAQATDDELLAAVYVDSNSTPRERELCERLERAVENVDRLEAQAELDKERIGQLTDDLAGLQDKLTRLTTAQTTVD